MFDRTYWTPDEPREADIAWNMQSQPHRALPMLGGKPFMEKPPLTYWMTAAAMHVFGDNAAAARLPNLLYAVLATLAIGALAQSMVGPAAALTAALIAGSSLLGWRVAIWVAPDAALVAGCAIGLLGVWRGYRASRGRAKLLWYGLMHVGALLGFMAKSAPGWLVPALALLVLIAWERRWRELLCWELYAGLLLQALVIGSWVLAVWRGPDGLGALRVLFWNNLAGRFAHVAAPAQFDYSQGHQNWPGKYFVQLPSYLYPWTLLALAAVWRAFARLRRPDARASAWRFAASASLPFLLLLSVASTARDVYAAPTIIGFALLVAVWLDDAQSSASALDRWALRYTGLLIGLLALIAALALTALAAEGTWIGWPLAIVSMLTIAVPLLLMLRCATRALRQHQLQRSLLFSYAAYVLPFTVIALTLFPVIDRVQNLQVLAGQVRATLDGGRLALLNPDETTIAMMNFRRTDLCDVIDGEASPGGSANASAAAHANAGAVQRWFATHGTTDRILVKLPGRAMGPLTSLAARFSPQSAPGDGVAGALQQAGVATLLRRFELPHGRRYALLEPAVAQPQAPTR